MANEDFWKEDSEEQLSVPVKSKRIGKTKKMEFDGWGSKPLIEFLKEIGKDTERQISQHDLTTIVNEYVNRNNLIHPVKKKRVVCDYWLRSLFGKKFVLRIKIYELLFSHLAENRDESEDEDSSNSEEKEENETTASRKRKASVLGKKAAPNSKKVPEIPKSCFASIIPENMKLVYLSRSLVQELLKDPETFESKVVGSYIRIKSDPNDYSQKNSHQLLQVTGVRKAPECGDDGAEYFLQVPHFMKEIPISKLPNENFKTEECEDLRQRIIAGSVDRPTVMELQQKAQILHEVITKQRIARELSLLQNLIDRANDKGWRRELFEYLERKELLEKPVEQERLLHVVPNVIAEELEPEAIVQPAEDEKNDFCGLPQLTIVGTSADVPFNTEADKSLANNNLCSTDAAASADVDREGNRTYSNGTTFVKEANGVLGVTEVHKSEINMEDKPDTPVQHQRHFSHAMISTEKLTEPQAMETIHQLVNTEEKKCIEPKITRISNEGNHMPLNSKENGTEPLITIDFISEGNPKLGYSKEEKGSPEIVKKLVEPQVIELSDDEDDQDVDFNGSPQIVDDPESKLWYYADPQQEVQGPFSMTLLKKWKGQFYFPPGFKVWKNGLSPVVLEDMISLMFRS